MTPLNLLLTEEAVDGYLSEHSLENGNVPIVAALLQLEGTSGGEPAAMLVIEVDGKKVIAKTTLRLLEACTRGLRIAADAAQSKGPPKAQA